MLLVSGELLVLELFELLLLLLFVSNVLDEELELVELLRLELLLPEVLSPLKTLLIAFPMPDPLLEELPGVPKVLTGLVPGFNFPVLRFGDADESVLLGV